MDRSAVVSRFGCLDLREVLWRVSSIPACRKCGRVAIAVPFVEINAEGRARFGGVATCQSIWACPVCAAPRRARRAAEITAGLHAVFADEGGALFVTLTVPHGHGDSLAELLAAVSAAWRSLTNGRFAQWLRDEFGLVGHIRAVEVTYGDNGWHPHFHILFVFESAPDDATKDRFDDAVFDRFGAAAVRVGLGAPSREHGVVTRRVVDSVGLAQYVATTERNLIGAALELALSNTKRGRGSHLAPFELLGQASFDAGSKVLWRNFEQGFRGIPPVRWSPGLKRRCGVPEIDDADLDVEEGGGYSLAMRLDPVVFADLSYRVRGFQGRLLEAVEAGGEPLGSHLVAVLLANCAETVERAA